MNNKDVEDYLLAKPGSKLDYPFGKDVAVYKVLDKMFALVPEGKSPISISLKCDPQLAETLREKYVEVMPGYHLNKKHWNTILLSGQMEQDEFTGLIDHSYQLVVDSMTASEQAKLSGKEE